MTNWHYKNMDAVAAISRSHADDMTLHASARELFLSSYRLANTLKLVGGMPHGAALQQAFASMCTACRHAQLHRCAGEDASFYHCSLVKAYSG